MNKKFLGIMAAALLAGPMASHAVPISYSMTYTAASGGGTNGTGSFVFDSDTNLLSDVEWSFVDGLSGHVSDRIDEFTGSWVFLNNCPVTTCGSNRFASGNFVMAFWQASASIQTYRLAAGNGNSYFGTFAVDVPDVTPVPEPGTLALFGLGLAGLGVMRRRRAA